jgi:ABC-2 type transport system ATP-binding protein
VLRLSSVSRTLGGHRVLDDVSLEIPAGAIHGLVGQNGAGKTTLVRLVVGLTRPDSGTVDRQARPAAPGRDAIGYLPEERGLYQRPRVGDILLYFARLKGLGEADAGAEVDRWLERVEMTSYRRRRVEQLSKGQQQKIQIAVAMMGAPALLVLDEPFSGLDPINTRLVCELVREEAGRGAAVLVSAHQLSLVEQLCSDVTMLAAGRVVLAGPMAAVRATPQETLEDLFVTRAVPGGGR